MTTALHTEPCWPVCGSRFWVLEVAILYPGLDDIEWCRNDERCACAGYGSDKVLRPGGFVVVFELVEVLFHYG